MTSKWAFILTSVVAVLGLGSLAAALQGPRKLNLPGPLVSEPPATKEGVTPHQRTLMVVIDGLRADTARTLPTLTALAHRGTSLDTWADAPTFSASQYVALLTGVPPRDSGVRDNAGLRPAGLDNVAARVRAQGRTAVHLGDDVDWWQQLFGASWSHAEVARPESVVERVAGAFANADFLLVHLCGVDSAGHNFGGSSPEYKKAALDADHALAGMLAVWQGPVVVVADHGHVDAGGHGGEEDVVRRTWLVLAGPGIQSGKTLPDGKSLDVAPTVAALLGVSAPSTAEGHTLVDALILAPDIRQRLQELDQTRLEQVNAHLQLARSAFSNWDVVLRLLRSFGALALVALLLGTARRFPKPLRWGLPAGLACAVGTLGVHLLWRGSVSFSASNQMGWVVAHAAGLSAAIAVVGLALARRGGLRNCAAGDDIALGFGFTLGAMPFALASFVAVGAFSPRLICEPSWLAAAPMVAYAAFVPPALLGLGVALPGMVRVWAAAWRRTPAVELEQA